jgi:hypothetical protein
MSGVVLQFRHVENTTSAKSVTDRSSRCRNSVTVPAVTDVVGIPPTIDIADVRRARLLTKTLRRMLEIKHRYGIAS